MSTADPVNATATGPDADAALMAAFRDGSLAAFETLVERWRDRLVTWFFWLCRDRDRAEDCCQEVFVKVYRARGTYMPEASFRSWLFTLARNHWIDVYRGSRNRRETVALDADGSSGGDSAAGQIAGTTASPDAAATDAEIISELAVALSRLPEEMRDVFLLGEVEGLRYPEVAAVLEVPVGTVKSRMFHAVRRLRGLLAHIAPPGGEARRGN